MADWTPPDTDEKVVEKKWAPPESDSPIGETVKKKESTKPIPTAKDVLKPLSEVPVFGRGTKERLQSDSSTSELAPLKSEFTKTPEFKIPEAALPSTKENPRPDTINKSDAINQHLDQQKINVEKDWAETEGAYNELNKKTQPLIDVLNNPLAPNIQKQYAQSMLQQMAPDIEKVQSKKDAYQQTYKTYLNNVDNATKQLKEISAHDATYSGGAAKSIVQGTADILDAMQGANNFISKYLFGHEVEGKGGYSQLADNLKEGAANNLSDMPDTFAGKVLSGVAGSIPIIGATLLAPETAIPRFATTMGAIGFGKSYRENKDVLKATQELGYGLTEGALLHGLGISSEYIGDWASKTMAGSAIGKELAGKSAAALITSTGFGGQDAVKQYLETGKINWDQVAASAGTGAAFSLSGIAKAAYEKAFVKTINAPASVVTEAINTPKSPIELKDESVKALEEGVGKSPEEKAKAFLISKSLSDIADIKAMGEDIANNPTQHISDVMKSDMPPEQKQAVVANINAIVEENNKNVQEAKPLKQEKANLESQLESVKAIEDPDLRDSEMNRLTQEIIDKDAEIKKVLSKPIIKTNESESQKESQKGQGSTSKSEVSKQGEGLLNKPEISGTKEVVAGKEITPPEAEQPKGGVYSHVDAAGNIYYFWEDKLGHTTDLTKQEYERLSSESPAKQEPKVSFDSSGKYYYENERGDKSEIPKSTYLALKESLTKKQEEHAAKEGQIEKGGKPEHIGTEAQRVSDKTSYRNKFESGKGGKAPQEEKVVPESVSHNGEQYTIERDSEGKLTDIKTSEGVPILDAGLKLKDFNTIAKIAEVKKEDVAAVSRAVGKSEMAEMGLGPLAKAEPRRWEAVAKEAKEKVDSGEVNPTILLNELERNPRTLSDTETAILVKHKTDIKRNYNDVLKQINEAKEGENIVNLLAKQAAIEEESVKFEKTFNDIIRPSAGRSLAALNMMMKLDYSLFSVTARGKAAEVGGVIPEKIKEIYKKQADKISELEKEVEDSKNKLQEVYDKLAPEFKKTDVSKAIRKQKYIQEAEERKSKRKVTKEEISVERDEILNNLKKLSIEQRSTLSANPINAKMIVEIGKLVNTYVKEGIVDFSQIIDDVHLRLKDVIPNITKEDVENAISESVLRDAAKEEKEMSIDALYSKFKLGADRTIDEIKKTSKNKNEATKKIKEIEKNTNYVKQFYDKAKKSEIEKKLAEKKVESTIKERKDKNRPRFIKILGGIKDTYKALILSGVKTPIKLASAVVNILALKPAYMGIGNLMSKVPFVADIYKKAPIQRMGVDDIAKAYSTLGSKEMFKESYRTLLGKSHFDEKNIDKQYHDSKILGFPGRFHAAIKVFAKLPEYESAKQSLIKQSIKNGEDPFTDKKMAEIEELSVSNALNSVLMDDNKVAALWNNFLLGASKSESDGIKALAELLSVEDPIVKVPLNQAAAVWEHIPVLGLLNRIGEIKRGAKQEGGLTPEQSNEIARNINRQGLGLLIGGLGVLYYKNLGGFQNWRSKKDKDIGVEELGVKIQDSGLPKILFHSAAWDIAQMSATIARENEADRTGVVGGIGKAAVGVSEETIPFVRSAEELAKTTEALKSGKLSAEAGKFVSKLISTSDTRKLAKYIDDERRTNPQGFWEAIANDIPGLRQYVTSVDEKKSKHKTLQEKIEEKKLHPSKTFKEKIAEKNIK